MGSRPMTARDSTVLPEPDSPTMPSVLPWSSVKDTPWTARSGPREVAKETRRSSTASSGSAVASGSVLIA